MKIDVKELNKALEYLKKNGDPVEVSVDFDLKSHFRIQAYTDLSGHISITIFPSEASKMAEVTKTERL